MSNLDVSSVELISSVRTVPLNGAPSSNDFNQFQKDTISDLASIVVFLNETLLPIISSLSSAAAGGLDGTGLWGNQNAVSTDTFFRDPNGNLYSVADLLSQLSAANSSLLQTCNDLNGQLEAIQTRLATTQQNDLRVSVQNLQDSVSSILSQISSILPVQATQAQTLANQRTAVVGLTSNVAQQLTVTINFVTPYSDNNYACSVTLETITGSGASILSWSKQTNGAGIVVIVSTSSAAVSANVNVVAQHL